MYIYVGKWSVSLSYWTRVATRRVNGARRRELRHVITGNEGCFFFPSMNRHRTSGTRDRDVASPGDVVSVEISTDFHGSCYACDLQVIAADIIIIIIYRFSILLYERVIAGRREESSA